jgi:hypothetical protein
MAGPRTLPRMFAHGLNVKAEALEFGQEVDAYRELPQENDAWTTAPMTAPGVTRGTPAPPPPAPPSPRAGPLPAAPASTLDDLQDELKRLVGAAATP